MWIGCLAASWVRAGSLFYLSIRRETNIVRRYGIRTQATLDHCPVKTYLHFPPIPFPIKSVRAHLFDTSAKIFSVLPSGNEQRRGKAFPPPFNAIPFPLVRRAMNDCLLVEHMPTKKEFHVAITLSVKKLYFDDASSTSVCRLESLRIA